MPRLRHLIIAWALALGMLSPAAAQLRVAVVGSVSGQVGEEFLGALRQSLGNGVSLDLAPVEDRGRVYAGAKLVVTLGGAALDAVMADRPDAMVLASLVPRVVMDKYRRGAGQRLSALYLGQSFERQLAVLKAAFPDVRRVGILTGPDSVHSLPWLERAAHDAGITLVVERGDGERLRGGLKGIVAGSDLLLVLPDPQVFNASTIQGILLETYRAGIPMMGISAAYTRAGAVLSVAASPVHLGAETAQMVREFLDGAIPESRYPLGADVHVNRQVARSLGLDLPSDDSLRAVLRGQP